jgi:hyaluronan synthase
VLTARRSNRGIVITGTIACLLVIMWAVHHVASVMTASTAGLYVVYGLSFIAIMWSVGTYMSERKHIGEVDLGRKMVVVNVPVYNEDPDALLKCIDSLLRQTRKPDFIHVVVNGQNSVDYSEIQKVTQRFEVVWSYSPAKGKRRAQVLTANTYVDRSDIFVTVDSDTILDPKAIEEGLIPFSDPKVYSVAGMILTTNNRASFLTRMTDLLFQTWQMTDRSSLSIFGSVMVNSGGLALYRAEVLIDNIERYLDETFFGRPVEFSDDSMLTLFSLERGKAVQQPTCFAFTLMPEKLSHHLRQQVRWSRGSFIRSWWRMKFLPLNRYAYWMHLFRWFQTGLGALSFFLTFALVGMNAPELLPYLVLIPIGIHYMLGLRYLAVQRSDESLGYRTVTWLLSPIAAVWQFFVLRAVRYYGIATCLNTGWGTRSKVEVTA